MFAKEIIILNQNEYTILFVLFSMISESACVHLGCNGKSTTREPFAKDSDLTDMFI